jgi:hypothetical protein
MPVEESRSEDLLVLFAAHPKTSNFDYVVDELKKFFQQKQQRDNTDRFNFIAFEENGPIYFDDFLFEPQHIITQLKELKTIIAPPNIAGGVMTAVTFIIDVFKSVGGKVFRLLVVEDRACPFLNNIEIVQMLVSQVVDFPFFIDIVRIGIDDPKEDLVQMKFARLNKGDVYFAKNERELPKIFQELSKKKMVPKQSEQGEKYSIPLDSEPFFFNLAQDMQIVDENERKGKRCQICGDSSGDIAKCPKCNTIAHGECMAQWAKMSNIGLPHIFRCMSCYNLLRLPKDFVLSVQSGKYKKPKISIKAADQTSLLRQQESATGFHLKKATDPLGGMGGLGMMGDAEVSCASENASINEDSEEEFAFKDEADLVVQFCPQCATLNPPEVIKCTKCGKRLK